MKIYRVFGGVHSDYQLDSLENDLNIYKSKDPKVWETYIARLKQREYDKPTHKEHEHYKWALSKLNKVIGFQSK